MRKFFYNIATDRYPLILTFPIKFVFWIISRLYGMGVKILSYGFDENMLESSRISQPVISVGNITWGGVGKTPFVIYLAEYLISLNKSVVVLTRGYRGEAREAGSQNDEVKMVQNYLKDLPILSGSRRYENAEEFLKFRQADVFLLDDGFQHRKLKRDLNIVLVDTTNPWGNGYLIPCGILREPKSALRRADIIVLTKVDLALGNLSSITDEIKRLSPKAMIIHAIHQPVQLHDLSTNRFEPIDRLARPKVGMLCSIAQPQAFEATLKKLNVIVEEKFIFMDHEEYQLEDIRKIISQTKQKGLAMIVTTAKDKVKLEKFLNEFAAQKIKLMSLEIRIEITHGREEFLQRIRRLL